MPEAEMKRRFPVAWTHLRSHEEELRARKDSRRQIGSASDWYRIIRYGSHRLFESEKILTPGESKRNSFAIDRSGAAFSFARVYAVVARNVATPFLAALLNSSLLEFALHSICPLKSGGYYTYSSTYLARAPIRRIVFITPTAEREELSRVGTTKAAEWIEAIEGGSAYSASFSDFSGSDLARWLNDRLSAQPEQADVVHDLLAHLAERMIAMHQQRQERIKAFWLDLEGVTDPDTFEDLKEHGKWAASLWNAEACRPFVDEESRSTRHLDESLGWNEDCFKAFVKMLAGRVSNLSQVVSVYRKHHPTYRQLVQRIAATDRLIDLVVYRLYGLTEEEVGVIEEGSRE